MIPASPTPPTYSRPPILEAVIGITFAESVKDSVLATVDRRFSKHYPAHQPVNNVSLAFKVDASVGATTAATEQEVVHGHRRMVPNMDELAVLLPDSLTVAQLSPYRGWGAFMDRFKRDWSLYKRPGKFRKISRIGVRFINRVDIPASGDVVEHEQYLNLYPRVPDALGPIVGYTMQSTFQLENIGCIATIRSATAPSPTLGHASFLVDIDVYAPTSPPMNEEGVFALLDQIRIEKNRIFEACITQRAREELFKHADM